MAVKIHEYQQQTSPNTLGVTPRARPVEFDNSMSRAGQRFAGALMGAVDTVADVRARAEIERKRQEEEDAKAWTMKATAEAQASMLKTFVESQDAAEAGAPGFTQKFNDTFDQYTEDALGNAPNEASKKFLGESLLRLKVDMTARALSYETDERRKWRVTTGKEAIDSAAAIVAMDPSRFDVTLAEQRAMIDSLDVPQEAKRALKVELDQSMSTAAVLGEVQRNPRAAGKKLAARLGVDEVEIAGPTGSPDIVWERMIQRESRGQQTDKAGNPTTSPKGAVGIAQIMPETGPEAARYANLPWDPERFKTDAHYNAALGRAYFDEQVRTFQHPALAAAAYNAGPGAVKEWLGKIGDPRKGEVSMAEFVKRIPYKETREYVASVAPAGPSVQQVIDADDAGMNTGSTPYDLLPVPSVVSLLGQVQTELNKEQAEFRSYVAAREADDLAAFGDGKQPPKPLDVGEFVAAYGEAEGVRRWDAYKSAESYASQMSGFKSQTPEQIIATVKANEPRAGEGYARQAQQHATAVQAATAVLTQRAKDPQQFAMDNGLSNAEPLNFQDTRSMGTELSKRVGIAGTMNEKYGTKYTLITEAESAQMTTMLGGMTAPERAQFVQMLRSSVPDDRAYQSVMAQIRPDSPVTAMAGSIMTQASPVMVKPGGWASRAEVMRPDRVATMILAGEDILNPTKGARGTDGKGGAFPMPSDGDMRDAWQGVVGDAYRGDPAAASASFQAYRAFYAAAAHQSGKADGELDAGIAEMAARAVSGGVADINGKSVVMPWGMPEDRFQDALRLQFEAAARAAGVSADFDSVDFLTIGNGVYRPSRGALPLPFEVRVSPGVSRAGMIGGGGQ